MRIENERIGMVCATIANVNRDPNKTQPYTPDFFFNLDGDGTAKAPERPDPVAFFDQMQRLTLSSQGAA